jgi:hypothetical protein
MADLTKPGSVNCRWLASIAAGSPAEDMPHDLTFAFASRDEDYEIHVIGWCSLACWNGHPAFEGFVASPYRSNGLAFSLACCLCLSQEVPREVVGVFSPEFVSIAERLGFQTVKHYKRVDDGWVVAGAVNDG